MLTTLNIVSLDQGKGIATWERQFREPDGCEVEAERTMVAKPAELRRLLAGLALLVAAWPLTTRRRRAIS